MVYVFFMGKKEEEYALVGTAIPFMPTKKRKNPIFWVVHCPECGKNSLIRLKK